MLFDMVAIAIGLAGLFFGGNWLVQGAARLANAMHISPLLIGLTVVSLGTSAPELVVNVSAALDGSAGLAMGNIVGSNIANVGLILGVAGVIVPVAIHRSVVKREIPITIGVSVLLLLLALDDRVAGVDGVVLLMCALAVTGVFYWAAQYDSNVALTAEVDLPAEVTPLLEVGRVVVGIMVLVVAAQLTVMGATNIARDLGVSELVIGLTLVAFGTSLPELAATLAAALKRQTDILVGNILGSNIYNIALILGVTALLEPVPVERVTLQFQLPVMIGYAVLLLPFARNQVLSRREGTFYVGSYLAFVGLTLA